MNFEHLKSRRRLDLAAEVVSTSEFQKYKKEN